MKKEDINLRLRSFKFWLYENDGLGLRQVVNDILEPLRKPISEDEIKKHTVVADLLKSNGKIGEQEYQSFIDRVKKEISDGHEVFIISRNDKEIVLKNIP